VFVVDIFTRTDELKAWGYTAKKRHFRMIQTSFISDSLFFRISAGIQLQVDEVDEVTHVVFASGGYASYSSKFQIQIAHNSETENSMTY